MRADTPEGISLTRHVGWFLLLYIASHSMPIALLTRRWKPEASSLCVCLVNNAAWVSLQLEHESVIKSARNMPLSSSNQTAVLLISQH